MLQRVWAVGGMYAELQMALIWSVPHLATFSLVFKKKNIVWNDDYIVRTRIVIPVYLPKLQALQIGAFCLEGCV